MWKVLISRPANHLSHHFRFSSLSLSLVLPGTKHIVHDPISSLFHNNNNSIGDAVNNQMTSNYEELSIRPLAPLKTTTIGYRMGCVLVTTNPFSFCPKHRRKEIKEKILEQKQVSGESSNKMTDLPLQKFFVHSHTHKMNNFNVKMLKPLILQLTDFCYD